MTDLIRPRILIDWFDDGFSNLELCDVSDFCAKGKISYGGEIISGNPFPVPNAFGEMTLWVNDDRYERDNTQSPLWDAENTSPVPDNVAYRPHDIFITRTDLPQVPQQPYLWETAGIFEVDSKGDWHAFPVSQRFTFNSTDVDLKGNTQSEAAQIQLGFSYSDGKLNFRYLATAPESGTPDFANLDFTLNFNGTEVEFEGSDATHVKGSALGDLNLFTMTWTHTFALTGVVSFLFYAVDGSSTIIYEDSVIWQGKCYPPGSNIIVGKSELTFPLRSINQGSYRKDFDLTRHAATTILENTDDLWTILKEQGEWTERVDTTLARTEIIRNDITYKGTLRDFMSAILLYTRCFAVEDRKGSIKVFPAETSAVDIAEFDDDVIIINNTRRDAEYESGVNRVNYSYRTRSPSGFVPLGNVSLQHGRIIRMVNAYVNKEAGNTDQSRAVQPVQYE